MSHDPISRCLREIYANINEHILNMAFTPDRKKMTLDACIQDEIIINRVLPDCNIVGGKTKYIILQREWLQQTDPLYGTSGALSGNTGVYIIPPEKREFKSIVAVIHVRPPHTLVGYQSMGMLSNNMNCGSGAASAIACNAMRNVLGISGGSTPTVELISGDMIRLLPPQALSIDWALECKLAFDENFTNLDPNGIRHLALLVLCATKTYIYNKLIVDLDRGYIHAGHELGVIKNIVENYSDQAERYQELLKNFQGSQYSDPMTMLSLFRHMIK